MFLFSVSVLKRRFIRQYKPPSLHLYFVGKVKVIITYIHHFECQVFNVYTASPDCQNLENNARVKTFPALKQHCNMVIFIRHDTW